MNRRAKIIKFVESNKKQIIFALFALLYILDAKTNANILKSAAPVVAAVAAEGAAAAGGAAAGGAAAGGAAAGGTAAGGAAASGTAAGGTAASGTAAGGTATGGTVAGGTAAGGSSSTMAANQARVQSAGNGPRPSTTSKSSSLSTNSLNHNNDGVRKTNESLTRNKPESERELKKEAKKEAKEAKKEDKEEKRRRLPERKKKKEEEEEEEKRTTNYDMDHAYEALTQGSIIKKLGCGCLLFFAVLLLVPTMFFSEISNTVTASTFLNNIIDEAGEVVDFFKGLYEKFENAFKYHYFASNKDVFNKKINDAYQKVYKEYGVPVDIPLLLSTLLTDTESLVPEIDENNEEKLSDETMRKLDYIEDLAMLQVIESEDIYICSSKVVDGKTVYYQILYTGEVDEANIVSGKCNASNVGKYFRGTSTKIDSNEYFEKLENNVLLTLLYPDYEESPHLIVETIKSKYEIYKIMYMDSEDEDAEFSLPADLMYDSEINMQAPLKGNISITSPFGGRGDVYKNGQVISSGEHNGIDLYASNKSIYAAGNGVVYRTYTENTGGNIVEIMHTTTSGKRYISQYAHLSQILVSKGEEVKAGDLIAIMGCTGSACSGTHLHFGIKDFDSNKWLNPRDIVKRTIS